MADQPLQVPIIRKPTPIVLDEMLVESWDSNQAPYDRRLEVGHYHPDQQKYPGFRLLKTEPTSYGRQQYFWANGFTAQDSYNATIDLAQQANLFPTFIRSYRVLRSDYLVQGPLTKLAPFTGVAAISVTAGGSGYTDDFAVGFSGGSGSNAAALAIVDPGSGAVIRVELTNVGTGYTSAPTISFSGGTGTGAAATAMIQPVTCLLTEEVHAKLPEDDPYQSIYDKVTRTWTTLPGPIISGTHIDDQSGIVVNFSKQVVAAGTVTSGIVGAGVIQLKIIDGGSGFTGAPTLTISGSPGSGATATATIDTSNSGKLGSVVLTNGGSGFTSVPTINFSGGSGSGASATAVLATTNVNSVALVSGGSGYVDIPVVTITDAATANTGTGATAVATLTPTGVDTATPVAVGSGYTMATVAVTGGGGTGAAVTANIVGAAITSYTVTNAGSGYTSTPTLTVSGDGSGATAVAALVATSVASVALTGTGTAYGAPAVNFSGGGGSGAAATATLAPTIISSIVVASAGSGYTGTPTITITGGGGGGASAAAVILKGFINAVSITGAGTGYTSSPTVTVSGGGGTGADIRAVIGGLSFVDYEPVTSVKGIKMTQSVDLSTLPPDRSFPVTYRVTFKDTGSASIVFAFAQNYASGLQETTLRGGSGPIIATMWERWMTESQYSAYKSPFGISVTGKSKAYTLVNSGIYNDQAYVFTFRPSPLDEGTGAGLVDLQAEEWRLKLRKVKEVVIGFAQ